MNFRSMLTVNESKERLSLTGKQGIGYNSSTEYTEICNHEMVYFIPIQYIAGIYGL